MRFKIFVIAIVTLLIGLPLYYFMMFSFGMVSCAGDFYRIKDFNFSFIKENKTKDSCDFKFFSTTNSIEASNQYAVSIKFKTEYYSLESFSRPFSLMAAREPGTQGSEEKIKKISVVIVDSITKLNYDITNFVIKPEFKSFKTDSDNIYFKNANVCIDGECWIGAFVFDSLSNFQNNFNMESYNLIRYQFDFYYMIFYLKNEAFRNINSNFRLDFMIEFDCKKLKKSFYGKKIITNNDSKAPLYQH